MAASSPHLWDIGKCCFASEEEGQEVPCPGKLLVTTGLDVDLLSRTQALSLLAPVLPVRVTSHAPHVQRDKDQAQSCANTFLSPELVFSLQRRN